MRLIPAHAGKTGYDCRWAVVRAAHPRSRGENVGRSPPVGSRSGSSPLTRGKPTPGFSYITANRLIPAHAGKTKLHAQKT